MPSLRQTIGLLTLTVVLSARLARAGDGAQVWHTIETDHFVIHYYDPNEDVARHVARAAERSFRVLTPALGHAPAEKTQVVITDDTDGANGFASVIPRNAVHLFASAPGSLSVLNDTDDHLFGLVAHEYTHILHLDTMGWLPRLYNRIFGKTWAPNQIQPRWWVEGIATYEESKRTSSGRGRNALFDMYLRVAVLAGVELDLDAVSTGPLRWPHGNAAYLYGSRFLEFIADRYGDDKLRAISREYGRQPIPFGLNRAVKRALGKDYPALYREWTEALREKYRLQRAAIERRGVIEGTKLTESGEGNGAPRFTPDGRSLVWLRGDGYSRGQLRVMPADGDATQSRKLAIIDNGGIYSLLRDGSGLVIEVGNLVRSEYDYTDLYRYDFATRKLRRLSHGLRAGDPDVSPDGTKVAFVVNGSGRWRLATMSLTAEEPVAEVIWEGAGRFDQAFTPRWSPDGARIVFTAWTTGGYRDLWLYDMATRTATRLTEDRAIDADPCWTPDGKWVVFTSDRTGIYNLYAIDPDTRELWQVTNLVGGAFAPDVSPDGRQIAYVGFEPDGTELYRLPFDRATWLRPEVYVDDRPAPTDVTTEPVRIDGPRDYRPIETLLPNRWEYRYGDDAFGKALTLITFGGDVVGRHGWSIGATYGFERGDVSFGAGYGYSRYWPSFRLGVGRTVGRPGGLVIDARNTRYTEEIWSGSASVGIPALRRPGIAADLSLGYDLNWIRSLTPVPVPAPGEAVPMAPETGVLGTASLGFAMSNARRYLFTLGQADGYSAGAALRLTHPALGSDFHGVELTWRWSQAWQMPWDREQILSWRYNGAIEQTERRRDGAYSIGGLPTQNIYDSIIHSTRVGTTYLRGYPAGIGRGRQYHLANLEYRAPLHVIEKGISTLPIYARRLHLAGLVDVGGAFDDFDPGELKVSAGASLRLDVVFGWFEPGSFDLGFSRGLMEGGENQWWFLLTGTL